MRPLLGGKGANLAEMTRIGLPVPDGFTITTEACVAYLREDGTARPGWTSRSPSTWPRWSSAPASGSATAATRCWSRCGRAR